MQSKYVQIINIFFVKSIVKTDKLLLSTIEIYQNRNLFCFWLAYMVLVL